MLTKGRCMKKIIIAVSLLASMQIYASQDFERDMYAYNYHYKELRRIWIKDRFIRPTCCAACITATVMAVASYVMYKFKDSSDSIESLLALTGIIGCTAFVPSLVSCLAFKWLFRLIKANSDEEDLKQSLMLITLRLKTAISEGRVTLRDLALCCSDMRCPISKDLMRYAASFRQQQLSEGQVPA
jgi:hypothetical protein